MRDPDGGNERTDPRTGVREGANRDDAGTQRQRLKWAGSHAVAPTVAAILFMATMTGVVAAQGGGGGICDTPIVPLMEWGARVGAGVLFLGGMLVGGFQHATAGISKNPEKKSQKRSQGTMAMVAGPIFGTIIVLGEQAAGAAGMNVAQCAQLTPWF